MVSPTRSNCRICVLGHLVAATIPRLLLLLCGWWGAWSCGWGERGEVQQREPALQGVWQVVGAQNDQGTEIDRFNGATFEFSNNGEFRPEGLRGLDADTYVRNESAIQLQRQSNIALTLGMLTDSVLILQLQVQGYAYTLRLQRPAPDSAQAPIQ